MKKRYRNKLINKFSENQKFQDKLANFDFKKSIRLIAGLIFLGYVVYFNSLFNGFVHDDYSQLVNNKLIQSLSNIPSLFGGGTFYSVTDKLVGAYYKPLMSLAFSLIYSVAGADAFAYHFFQVTLHIINTSLLFLLFTLFFKRIISFALALVFLVHPINVEAVSYISAFQEVFFFFFGMLSLAFLVKDRFSLKNFFIILLFLLLSLLSKETGILFIFILLFFNILFQQRILIPLFAGFFGVVWIYILLRVAIAHVYIGKTGYIPIANSTFLERLQNIPAIIFFYLNTFMLPLDLVIDQTWVISKIDLNQFFLPLVMDLSFFALIGILGFYLRKRENFKIYLFFLSWFILGLSLHLQLWPLDDTVADRWFYFPMVGLLGIIGLFLQNIMQKNQWIRLICLICFTIILIAFSARTIVRNFNYKDNFTLYTHDSRYPKKSVLLENNLGNELEKIGKFQEAKQHFETSVKIFSYPTNLNNLGISFTHEGNYQKAQELFEQAIEKYKYIPDGKGLRLANINLASIFFETHQYQKSYDLSKKGVEFLGNNPNLLILLALSADQLSKKEEALEAAKKANQIAPNTVNTYVYTNLKNNLPIDLDSLNSMKE